MNYLFLTLIFSATLLLWFIWLRFKAFYGWKPITAAVAIGGLFNVLLCYALSVLGVLKYNAKYLIDAGVSGIPLEQILLSFLLPFTFLTIYYYLNATHPLVKADKYSLSISNLLMGLCIAVIFFAYNKGLAVVTFSLLLPTLFVVEYKNKLRFMLQFYRSYALALILFLLIFIPVNLLSIYKYTPEQTIELKIAYIPFESYFYFLTMGLVSVFAYEVFKKRI
jgi:hypothetical protein